MTEDIFSQALNAQTKTSDFIVGEDSFKDLEIRDSGNGKGFYYFFDRANSRIIKRFVLGVSKSGLKTCCEVTFIEKDGKYTPRLSFSIRDVDNDIQKEEVTLDEETKSIKSRVSLDQQHQNLWDLINFIRSAKNVDVPKERLVTVSVEDLDILKKVAHHKDFVGEVLRIFSSPDDQDILLDASRDDVEDLLASVKHARNKKALMEVNELVSNDTSSEKTLENWIKENEWVFGIEYLRKMDTTKIGLHSDTDFLVESLDGFIDLIELKKANVKLFNWDNSHKCYYPTFDLSYVLGQTVHYIDRMEEYRHQLLDEDGLNVLKPRAKIVIGRSEDMDEKERAALRRFNDTLHNIEILTYTEIIQRAEKIVAHCSTKDTDSTNDGSSDLNVPF